MAKAELPESGEILVRARAQADIGLYQALDLWNLRLQRILYILSVADGRETWVPTSVSMAFPQLLDPP
jgi:hypothetical protein